MTVKEIGKGFAEYLITSFGRQPLTPEENVVLCGLASAGMPVFHVPIVTGTSVIASVKRRDAENFLVRNGVVPGTIYEETGCFSCDSKKITADYRASFGVKMAAMIPESTRKVCIIFDLPDNPNPSRTYFRVLNFVYGGAE